MKHYCRHFEILKVSNHGNKLQQQSTTWGPADSEIHRLGTLDVGNLPQKRLPFSSVDTINPLHLVLQLLRYLKLVVLRT